MKLLLLVAIAIAAARPAQTQSAQAPSAASVEVRRDIMVPMRDGVRLAADLYLPTGSGPAAPGRFPTLVSRTPYNRAGLRAEAEFYAQRGYAVVAQDVRGRFGSEGRFYPFVQEGLDGYDTIEWAAAQDWSNGKIGTFGASYLAWDQYRAAMERPPHLAAMFANVGGANFYQEFGYPGGAPNPGWAIWIVKSAETSPAAQKDPEAKRVLTRILENPGDWLRQSPVDRAKVFEPFPVHRRIYEDFLAHTTFDAYWHDPAFLTPAGWSRMKDVPILFISGWYDYFGTGALKNFEALTKAQRTPKRLVMGPWWHAIGSSSCGDGFFGDDAGVAVRELTASWFDMWLKGKPADPKSVQPVRYFRMGGGSAGGDAKARRAHGGEWLTASAWPLPAARPVRLYLGTGGKLVRSAAAGPPLSFVFDPSNPVPTIGGRYGMGSWTPLCFQDQVCRPGVLGCKDSAPLAARSDVLTFATDPLEEAMEVTGSVRVRLWISSDAPDTDFTAKLIDVAADGYAAILADGQVRARYRSGFAKGVTLKPGEVVPVDIDLGPTSNLFAKGHRVRVDISSSNWPQIDPNPNTGAPVNTTDGSRKARNTVYMETRRHSHIELPIVPARGVEKQTTGAK